MSCRSGPLAWCTRRPRAHTPCAMAGRETKVGGQQVRPLGKSPGFQSGSSALFQNTLPGMNGGPLLTMGVQVDDEFDDEIALDHLWETGYVQYVTRTPSSRTLRARACVCVFVSCSFLPPNASTAFRLEEGAT